MLNLLLNIYCGIIPKATSPKIGCLFVIENVGLEVMTSFDQNTLLH